MSMTYLGVTGKKGVLIADYATQLLNQAVIVLAAGLFTIHINKYHHNCKEALEAAYPTNRNNVGIGEIVAEEEEIPSSSANEQLAIAFIFLIVVLFGYFYG